MAAIQALAQNGIAVDYEHRLEEYSALFCGCLPELSYLLYEAIPENGDILETSSIDNYGTQG